MKTALALAKCVVVPTCFLKGDEVEAAHVLKPLVWGCVALVAAGVVIGKACD